jgi:hypothetical protein
MRDSLSVGGGVERPQQQPAGRGSVREHIEAITSRSFWSCGAALRGLILG